MRTQYIETLIRLVELNQDDTWLNDFLALRSGKHLPCGGAGSLNDWGPLYNGLTEQVWYGKLYEILLYLGSSDSDPAIINNYKPVKFRNNIRIITCLNCKKSYQHPAVFEAHFALDFFCNQLAAFTAQGQLVDIIEPSKSFNSPETITYRQWLTDQYTAGDIKIYDFVTARYICPHCGISHADFDHDLYKIETTTPGIKSFRLFKQNADWNEFEE